MVPAISYEGVGFRRAGRDILSNFTMAIPPGEVVVLLGRSGSGKTTALKLVNALLSADSGTVSVLGRDTSQWDVVRLRRSIGYVIQDVGLLPHFTIRDNVGLVPRLDGKSGDAERQRYDQLLRDVGLDPASYGRRHPHELSGGERQRVGIARALASDPPILLMDEPFGALDPITRRELQEHFLDLQRRLKKTCVVVTHDLQEAMLLADRIALLETGKLSALCTPREFANLRTGEAGRFLHTLEPGAKH